jgi:hypothetical protein
MSCLPEPLKEVSASPTTSPVNEAAADARILAEPTVYQYTYGGMESLLCLFGHFCVRASAIVFLFGGAMAHLAGRE